METRIIRWYSPEKDGPPPPDSFGVRCLLRQPGYGIRIGRCEKHDTKEKMGFIWKIILEGHGETFVPFNEVTEYSPIDWL